MPAPTLEVLLNIQANLEKGFAAYFKANGVSSFNSRSTANLADERIILRVEVGAAEGHQSPVTITGTGAAEEDMFQFTVKIYAQTERSRLTASPIPLDIPLLHDYYVARIKKLMLRGALKGTMTGITALNLSYYNIPRMTYSGDNYAVEDEGLDTTEITYTGLVHIMADAWPV